MTRHVGLAALICVNLILITGILLFSYSIPAANAQTASLASDYLVVAGEIQDQHDALYMIDMRTRFLHIFYFDRGQRMLKYAGWRDLEQDFRNNRP